MNQRDIEDVVMQGRETARSVMDEALGNMNEEQRKRAVAQFWRNLPEEVKQKMAEGKPEIVQQMNDMYQPQGNPWGTRKEGKNGG